MKYGIYDRYGTLSVESRFRAVQEFFKNNEFSSSAAASSKAGSLGLAIEDILSLNLGGQTSSSNFSAWRSELLRTSFEVAEQKGLHAATVEQISGRITELVGICLTQKGTHLFLVPGNDTRSFSVTVDYQPTSSEHPTTTGRLTMLPATVANSCAPRLLDTELKIGPEGKSFACTRLPSDTVTVVANLADGSRTVRYDSVVPPRVSASCSLDPTSIPYGGSSTLSWEVKNATKVQLGAGDGALEEVQAQDRRTVHPISTTDYRLTSVSQQGASSVTHCELNVQPKPPVISGARTHFRTTDNDKDGDTFVYVAVQCGGSTIAAAGDTYGHFDDNSDNGWHGLNVSDPNRRKDQIIGACVAALEERPNGHDEWHFDWDVEVTFSDGTSQTVHQSCNVDHDRRNCSKGL